MTAVSETKKLAIDLVHALVNAQTDKERQAIQPLAIEAAEANFAEALERFRQGTFRILELSAKLRDAIGKIGGTASAARLEAIEDKLGTIASILHDAEGMRTTWATEAEFQQTFPDERDVPPAAVHGAIPPGAALGSVADVTALSTSRKFEDLADEYVGLFRALRYKDSASESAAKTFADRAMKEKATYDLVENATSVPWWFVAGVHLLESSFNFKAHLHNGDPLSARTFRVPVGRPPNGNPPFKWAASAADALAFEQLTNRKDWSLARALFRWEAYNGFGYRNRRIPTPYLWSFSTHYSAGKFVGDGVFDAAKVSQQCGAAVFLKALADLGAVTLDVETFDEGAGDADATDAQAAAAVVQNQQPNIDNMISANADFQSFFEERLPDLKHFKWHEFLVKGGSHQQSGLNTDPPREKWGNILQLASILDRFREDVGHPVVLTSVYRSPDYNKTLKGAATNSQHMQFRAADVVVVGGGTGPKDWHKIFDGYRKAKLFEGGLGLYKTFVHVDTRGVNANW